MMFDGDEADGGMGGDAAMPETPSEGGDTAGGDDAGMGGDTQEGGM